MNPTPYIKSCLIECCTGTKLSVQLLNEMRRRKQKYGVMTIPLRRDRLCVGTGHPPTPCFGGRRGAASVFELLN
jgi:acetyl-CoA acyltransferase